MPHLAFVILGPGGGPVSAEALSRAWQQLWPDEDPLELEPGEDEAVHVFDFMGEMATVSFMPGPYPWPDLEGPAACAWHWPEATEVLQAGETHLLVGLVNEQEPSIARSIKLTLLVATACAAAPAASAVYWASGTTVLPAERFVESALEMTPEDLPVFSWVEFRMFPDDDQTRWSLFTTGMAALGHMEIEIREATLEPGDLIERGFDIAHYLCQAGPVLKDGDTLGASEEERILVRHVPSAWEREGTVILLEM